MDTALIIFTVGTAASFLPMYWIAMRLTSRRTKPVAIARKAAGDPSGRREFLDLLRREAASRAVAVLHEALVEARLTADQMPGGPSAISAQTRRSLDETGRLIDSLFSSDLREIFRNGIETLTAASATSIGAVTSTITAAIAEFERSLDGGGEGSPASVRPRTRRALACAEPSRRRGGLGGGNVGAAA